MPRATQLRRLRRLAEAALREYDLGPVRLTPVQHWLNTTFRVDVAPDGAAPARYALRIHRPDAPGAATIRAELAWLAALCEAGLGVPEPVAARSGALAATAATPGVPELRRVTLFRWLDGRFLRARFDAVAMERAGAFLARLHEHGARFAPPAGFARPRWDLDGLLGGAIGIDPALGRAALVPDERATIDMAAKRLRRALAGLGEGPDAWGLIHADYHRGNILFHRGEVRAIDFDNCGWGHYAYDLAVTCSTLLDRPDFPALRAALLAGYRRVRPLPARQERALPALVAGRVMAHTLWIAAHRDDAVFRPMTAQRIAAQIATLRRLAAE